MRTNSFLSLGDSYTIGEGVVLTQNFPYQLVQILRQEGHHFSAPEIIAKTGWTTDELLAALEGYIFSPPYDIVTLLIGVNNQYRGRSVEEYTNDLEKLIEKSIALASKKSHVILISIPDYGITPFGKEKDVENIAREIDIFNGVGKALSVQYKIHYVDIVEEWRATANDENQLAADGLHPSAISYAQWAVKIAEAIRELLK
ncbi:MAG TPA: SGNH/GDSL hydrolase family protein [Flavisolibacter sp.]|jgi:lysophospholipase L1-like esterase|nr:SGNH/GDSL hydrolase family protein [Flavisolibacter sp.]